VIPLNEALGIQKTRRHGENEIKTRIQPSVPLFPMEKPKTETEKMETKKEIEKGETKKAGTATFGAGTLQR